MTRVYCAAAFYRNQLRRCAPALRTALYLFVCWQRSRLISPVLPYPITKKLDR